MPLVFKRIAYGRRPGGGGRLTATLSFEGELNDVPIDLEISLPWLDDASPPAEAPHTIARKGDAAGATPSPRETLATLSEKG